MSSVKHGMAYTRFYNIWQGMKKRCYRKGNSDYDRYGGLGIICEWDDFVHFRNDMYESYLEHSLTFGEKNTTIDRIDSKGNYSCENCKWSTYSEQANNRKSNVLIKYNGKVQNVTQWAKELNINRSTIYMRLRKGWKDPVDILKNVTSS